ncbi:RNA polymerase sigma-70 factor [Hymenobacter sp. YC55]|uniref:RNA polymerase sigma factor n=1 Tax=Hymenobacter sp. YC55 TaxID=3034019 RepID=UPI0023F91FA3|nr:RNA polymerase sigma-70 factor [Hymenobacter sp. YC55]MDF7810407.1 RNA polymerase sigma-70 factor [Hymenobacter sp. YC55]
MARAPRLKVRLLVPRTAWDDQALVRAMSEGDTRAFAEMYERYWYQLLEAAYGKLNSREAAEEVVQDVFTALWHKRQTNNIQHLKSYLFTAVRYRIIDSIRLRLSETGYLHYSRTHLPEPDHSTEDTIAAHDLSGALEASLTQLPEHTRQVFLMSRFEHQTVPEIAGQLNLSRKTVEYHLTRALKLLRVSLRDFIAVLLVYLW